MMDTGSELRYGKAAGEGRPREGQVESGRPSYEHLLGQVLDLEVYGQLMGNVAHELNNALSKVLGYAELALGEELEGKVRDQVQRVHAGGWEAADLVRHVQSFSRRLRAGRQEIEINGMVRDALALLRRSFERGNTILLEELAEDVPPLMAHAGQVQLLVLHLLLQALERLQRGGKGGVVQVRTFLESGKVRIEVEDDGPGIPAEDLEGVLEMSFKKTAGQELGIGRAIVRAHGGEMWFAATEEGMRLVAELPVGKVPG